MRGVGAVIFGTISCFAATYGAVLARLGGQRMGCLLFVPVAIAESLMPHAPAWLYAAVLMFDIALYTVAGMWLGAKIGGWIATRSKE